MTQAIPNFHSKREALLHDLERRLQAVDQILLDLNRGRTADSALPFADTLTVVDWSEVHAYICASGVIRTDPLLSLLSSHPLGAHIVNGAHQAALSFLFHAFPGPLVLLPPHVLELQTFVTLAQRFVSVNTIDAVALTLLHNQLVESSVPVRRLRDMFDKQLTRQSESAHPLTARDASAAIAALSVDEADEIRSYVRKFFGPMFLLGRWMSVSAYRDLLRLLKERRLCFLRDHAAISRQVVSRLSRETAECSFWVSELPAAAEKAASLVRNDARALGYLQALNYDLHCGDRQLLFVSRGADVAAVIRRHPEWFSCMADKYFRTVAYPSEREGAEGVEHVPRLSREWTYFLELGAVWDPQDEARVRARLADRRDWLRSTLTSISSRTDAWSNSGSTKAVLADYIERVAMELENARAVWSAKSDSLNRKLATPRSEGDDLDSESLLAFLRYVTDPETFVVERDKLRDELAPVMAQFDATLPPSHQEDPSGPYKPLLRRVVEKVPEAALTDRGDEEDDRELLSQLLVHIQRRLPWDSKSLLAQRLRNVRPRTPTRDVAPGPELSPARRLVLALQAYIFNDFRKSRILLPRRVLERLRGTSRVIACLVVADSWLLDAQRLRKVDEVMQDVLNAVIGEAPAVRLAVLNALLGVELDAADEQGENPETFRRSLQGELMLEKRLGDVVRCHATLVREPLDANLSISVANNVVYGTAKLAFIDGESEEEPGVVEHRAREALGHSSVREFVSLLEARHRLNPDRVEYLDTLAYYWFKLSVLDGREPERMRAMALAHRWIKAALRAVGRQEEGPGVPARVARAVATHHALINSLPSVQGDSEP